jgi:FAD:protein FMN transferase
MFQVLSCLNIHRHSAAYGFVRILLFCVLAFSTSCATNSPILQRFEFTRPQMGLPFRIVLYAADEAAARRASDAAYARVEQLNNILSDYEYDSELSALSRNAGTGQAVRVSDELWFVLTRAQRMSEESRGAFDVTVGPVVSLWRHARREKKMPDAQRLEEARKATGFKNLKLDPKGQTATLLVPKMRLDLGAIAKGYAIDEALKVLKKFDIRSALVSGGGDMAASEPPPGKKGWKVELMSSTGNTNVPPDFVLLKNRALATSGDMFQFVELDGKRFSHIVDPRTGLGLTDRSLVVVIAADCMTADSLSTTVSVLGPEEGLRLVRSRNAVSRVMRNPAGKVELHDSPGFVQYLEPATARQ